MEKGVKIVSLVVVIVAVLAVGVWVMSNISYQAGIFNPGESSSVETQTGFGALKPVEWTCSSGTVTLSINNGAGGPVTEVKANGNACEPMNPGSNQILTCTVPNAAGCVGKAAGQGFQASVQITYVSPTGIAKTNTGTVSGAAQ